MTANFTGGDGGQGPVRGGIFATNISDRTSAGATYYGIMEMTGNVAETVVAIGAHATFKRTWGNGALSASGYHDVADWPVYNTTNISNGAGTAHVGYKGGGYNYNSYGYLDVYYVSSRYSIIYSDIINYPTTNAQLGGRGVR